MRSPLDSVASERKKEENEKKLTSIAHRANRFKKELEPLSLCRSSMGASASAPAEGLARTPTARRSGFRLANGDGGASSSSSATSPPHPSSSTPADPADYDFIAECLLGLLLFSGSHGPAAAAAAARSTFVVSLKAGDILAREGDSSGGSDGSLAPSASSGALASLASGAASSSAAPPPAPTNSSSTAATELYIVKSGTLEVIESRGGSAVRVDLKRRGDCVGEVRESFFFSLSVFALFPFLLFRFFHLFFTPFPFPTTTTMGKRKKNSHRSPSSTRPRAPRRWRRPATEPRSGASPGPRSGARRGSRRPLPLPPLSRRPLLSGATGAAAAGEEGERRRRLFLFLLPLPRLRRGGEQRPPATPRWRRRRPSSSTRSPCSRACRPRAARRWRPRRACGPSGPGSA